MVKDEKLSVILVSEKETSPVTPLAVALAARQYPFSCAAANRRGKRQTSMVRSRIVLFIF